MANSQEMRNAMQAVRSWEDNIRTNLKETGWNVTGWINFAQEGQVTSCCENGNEPSGSIQFMEFLE
jgi:hypothetical protein